MLRWLNKKGKDSSTIAQSDVFNDAFVCRPCYRAYESFMTKEKKLYEAMECSCLKLLDEASDTPPQLEQHHYSSEPALTLTDNHARKWLIQGIGKILHYEIKKLCSNEVSSVIQSKSNEHIHNFPWMQMFKECSLYCPTLQTLLLISTKTKTARKNQLHVISVVICMLAKFHCSNMSLFQRLISTILYAGHAGSKVICLKILYN
jgi:hypothetical protein